MGFPCHHMSILDCIKCNRKSPICILFYTHYIILICSYFLLFSGFVTPQLHCCWDMLLGVHPWRRCSLVPHPDGPEIVQCCLSGLSGCTHLRHLWWNWGTWGTYGDLLQWPNTQRIMWTVELAPCVSFSMVGSTIAAIVAGAVLWVVDDHPPLSS